MKDKKRQRRKNVRPRRKFEVRVSKEYPWKVLEKISLDLMQFLTEEENKRLASIIVTRDLDAYFQLSEDWSLQSIDSTVRPLPEWRAKLTIANLLKKFDFPGDRDTRIETALQSFYASENSCFRFNQNSWRALSIGKNDKDIEFNTYILSFIRKVIGDFPEKEKLVHWSRHGPGSTTQTEGQKISQYWKFSNWPYAVTEGAEKHARRLIETDDRWLGALEDSYRERYNVPKYVILNRETFWSNVFETVDGSRITTVPKSAKTERTIAIEPTLNLYLQLGVDGYIRRRLKRWGIDIDCQAKNQELARRGSITGDYVTLDLSAASDSISKRLLKQILPSGWFSYLDELRSHYGWVQQDLVEFEKFSSMGNGFTFAIETLVFAAIVYAAKRINHIKWNPAEVAVFGDDIIVHQSYYLDVIHGLHLCGFTINEEKSFSNGFSRESCGADWHRGFDVRPIFLKRTPRNLKELFSDINRIKRLLDLWFSMEDSSVNRLLMSWVPPRYIHITGPYSQDEFDTYLHSSIPKDWKNGYYVFSRLVSLPVPSRGPTNFLFRKLMANLSGNRFIGSYPRGSIPGSIFDVVDRGRVRHTIVPASHTETWCDRYDPHVPDGQSLLWL